jgi:hypothetical protein
MNPETQQRLTSLGCLLILVMLIAGIVAAFLGHPKYLLPVVPLVLLWIIYGSARRKAERQRELEAFAEAFRNFDGSPPRLASPRFASYGWPGFEIVFDSRRDLQLAKAQGRVDLFKTLIQGIHGHISHHGQRFDPNKAVFTTYEGEFDSPEQQLPCIVGLRASIWSQLNYWAGVVVSIGTALGTIAIVFLGREFTKDELGIFAWPLTILWLASFFYAATYLVFTKTSGWVRILWLITLSLFLLGLSAALFSRNQNPGQPPANTGDSSSSTPSP